MKNLFILLIIVLIPIASQAQYDVDDVKDSKETKKSKSNWENIKQDLYIGGDINAAIGSSSFLYFAPFIGYEFMPSLSTGISTMLKYQSQPYGNSVIGRFSKGAGLFFRYKPQFPLILETSFNVYSSSYSGITIEPEPAKSWMLGVGYAYSMGERSYSQIMIQYDILKDEHVPENLMLLFPGGGRLYYKFGIIYYLND